MPVFNNQNVAIIGDAKSGFQSGDHNGWIVLDGRAKTTLTTTQQANATALGIGANLPNATGRGFTQGTLLSQIGSNTIAQNQLPNLQFTPTISSRFNTYNSTATPIWDNAVLSGITNFAMTQSTPEAVNQDLQTGGILSITSSPINLNGSVTQQSYTPASIGVNQFIYLGL